MLNALIQTAANLGFDSTGISNALSNVLAAIQNGDLSSLQGVLDLFSGVVSAITGIGAEEISVIIPALLEGIIELISTETGGAIIG